MLAAACSGSSYVGNDSDSADDPDVVPDTVADTTPDTTPDTAPDVPLDTPAETTVDPDPDLPPPCDLMGHENHFDSAEGGVDAGHLLYISDSDDPGGSDPFHSLIIDLREGSGVGTYDLAASYGERNLATCSICVYIRAGCDSTGECGTYYFQTEGQLEIEYTGNPGDFFAGAITDVRLVEVTVDFDTWESTPVEGGDVWCIDRYDFYQEIAPFP
jgi:hypothetical protein